MSCFTEYKGLSILDSSHDPTGEAGIAIQENFIFIGDKLEVLDSDVAAATASVGALETQVNNLALDDLSDVGVTVPSTGQTLVYSGSTWANGKIDFDKLEQVAIGPLTTGQALVYNGTTWTNGKIDFDKLEQVAIGPLTTGQALVYSGSSWTNGKIDFDKLEQVAIGPLTTGQALVYSGAAWTNGKIDFDKLEQVDISMPGSGDSLRFDSSDDHWKSLPGVRLATMAKTSNYTIGQWDCVILGNNPTGTINITLPASPGDGDNYYIKRIGAGDVTIQGTVDGVSNPTLSLHDCYHVVYHAAGSGWYRM